MDWMGMLLAACCAGSIVWALTARERLPMGPRKAWWERQLAPYLQRSEPLIPRKEWLLLMAASGLGGALFGLVAAGPAGLGLASLGYVVPELLLRRAQRKQHDKLDQQVMSVTGSLVRSLRAGIPLLKAIEQVAKVEPEPISTCFARLRDMVYTGMTLGRAAEEIRQEVDSERLRVVLKVLRVSQEQGMSMDDVLQTLTRLADNMALHERIRVAIHAQTAGTRASQWLVAGLVPFVLIITLRVPTVVRFYRQDPVGRLSLGIVLVLELVAIFAGKEITRFRGPLGA